MIAINAREKELITERFPNVHIVRTVKQKSHRHRYFCTETPDVLELIADLRGYEYKRPDRRNYGKRQNQRQQKNMKGRGVDHRD